MHRAVAAVRDQREVARVGAVAGEHLAGGVRHVGVHDAFDAPRGVGDVDTERLGDVVGDRGAGRVDVERHAPAGEAVDGQVAEHRVGVGHASAGCRRGRNTPGPGVEPADSGPTSSAPWRTRAIEPPPAPTLCTSTIGSPM